MGFVTSEKTVMGTYWYSHFCCLPPREFLTYQSWGPGHLENFIWLLSLHILYLNSIFSLGNVTDSSLVFSKNCGDFFFKQSFLTSAPWSLGAKWFFAGELSCALQDVKQHLWSLPTKYQQHLSASCPKNQTSLQTMRNIPRQAKLPSVENHCFKMNWWEIKWNKPCV